jgi:hypothetical protein
MRERSWLKVIQKIFRVFQNPHKMYATTRVNSFAIFLLSLFYCGQNLCQVNRQFFRRTSWWSNYCDLMHITIKSNSLPPEVEVKETTDTASSASFLDLYLEFDDSGQLSTRIYDKLDNFNFKIINFPNMCSNIPASPAYVCITILEQNR